MKYPGKILNRNSAVLLILILCAGMRLTAQVDSLSNREQFLFKIFSVAEMKLKTGESVTPMMNYNTLSQKMTFYQDGNLLDLIKPEAVDTIFLQNKVFVFINDAFYEVLVNNSVSLFIQHRSSLISTGRPGAYGVTSQAVSSTSSYSIYLTQNNAYNLKLPDDFKIKYFPIFWVRINNVMHRFQTERQFLKNFPAKENEIKLFINQSDIDIKKYDDLIKLVNYCNELYR